MKTTINVFIFLIFNLIISCSGKKSVNFSKNFSNQGLMDLEIGMTKSQTIKKIGLPYNDTIRNEWEMTKKEDGVHTMVWVGFDSLGLLNSVQVVHYDFFDDQSIYGLKKDSGKIQKWGCKSSNELSEFL